MALIAPDGTATLRKPWVWDRVEVLDPLPRRQLALTGRTEPPQPDDDPSRAGEDSTPTTG